jgi:hypothetical protein
MSAKLEQQLVGHLSYISKFLSDIHNNSRFVAYLLFPLQNLPYFCIRINYLSFGLWKRQ